ncbi:hypothetical protein WISP_12194 [Willisornis vidua]|uniref:Reverse transcriptase domain-containing protein n=1 Tax=Willisornis vidua TaxID=1566151 RepID=A0ABQ9DVG9_9PASS|nr:hypothetical protein WISP_12194 [Willisornis vidua]
MLCLMPPRAHLALLAARALLTHIQPAIDQDPQVPFHGTAFQHLILLPDCVFTTGFYRNPFPSNADGPMGFAVGYFEIKCTLIRFADDTKLVTPERQDAIQRDLDYLEKQAHRYFMKFNKSKCKSCCTCVRAIPKVDRLGEAIEGSLMEKKLGVLVEEKLDMSQVSTYNT